MTVINWVRFQSKRIKRRLVGQKPIHHRLVSSAMRLIELPDFGIFVDPQDALIGDGILKRGDYEPHLSALISRRLKPGQRFLDIGANVGYHTLTAAKKVGPKGRCLAVDLNPNNCALLRASCEFNRFGHVEIHQKAAGATSGEITFFTPPNTGNSAVVSPHIRNILSQDPSMKDA